MSHAARLQAKLDEELQLDDERGQHGWHGDDEEEVTTANALVRLAERLSA